MLRRAVAGAFIALAALLLAGCTATAPEPTPTMEPTVPSPTPTPTPEPPVSTFALVCQPPTEQAIDWLRNVPQGDPDASTSDAVMVNVGTGVTPYSQWWVLAAPYHDVWGDSYTGTWLVGSATYPGTLDTWIVLFTTTPEDSAGKIQLVPDWQRVTWTGDRLARGQQAQAMAIGCLRS
jgi:hypothetical protein